jgi:MoaA/NifB/PqqE/SkfB family radical SAM enzyme
MQVETFTEKLMKCERETVYSLVPPYPTNLSLTLTDACNHKCITCSNAYYRGGGDNHKISKELAFSIMEQAYNLGAREVGLHGGGPCEPFLSPILEDSVLHAKKMGYTYIYLTTNGSLATKDRLKKIFENGLHSIRFSINADNRETYKAFHGVDNFDKAVKAVRIANELRKEMELDIILTVSFVQTKINEGQFDKLKKIFSDTIDSIYKWEARNNNGILYEQMKEGIVLPNSLDGLFDLHSKKGNMYVCPQPFNRFQVNAEGYLNSCCVGFRNYMSIADLNKVTLKDAWENPVFQKLRQMLIDNNIPKNIQCYNCLNNTNEQMEPLLNLLEKV